jgi:hypothetical protein
LLFRLNLERGRSNRSVTLSFGRRAFLLASRSTCPPPCAASLGERGSLLNDGAAGGGTGGAGRGAVGAFFAALVGTLVEELVAALVEDVGIVGDTGGRSVFLAGGCQGWFCLLVEVVTGACGLAFKVTRVVRDEVACGRSLLTRAGVGDAGTARMVGAMIGACGRSLVGVRGARVVLDSGKSRERLVGCGRSRERLAGACGGFTREGVTDLVVVAPCGRSLEAARGTRNVWV